MYTYIWYHWITFFFFYCFFGWIFESSYVSLKTKHFVNRGFLRLPMLPLYGTGAVMMLWVSLPVKNNLLLVYLFGVIAATLLEYVTGYMMERLFKVRYWDYSYQKYNLHGYICLSSSIAWGFLTILMTEVIHKPIERLVLQMNPVVEFALIGMIGALFLADSVQSTREALNLARMLEAMTKMRTELEDLQVQIALLKAEASQRAQELKEEQRLKIAGFQSKLPLKAAEIRSRRLIKEARFQSALLLKTAGAQPERLRSAAGFFKDSTLQKLEKWQAEAREIAEKRQKLTHYIRLCGKRILRGNPGATSRWFAEALKELHDTINHDKTA